MTAEEHQIYYDDPLHLDKDVEDYSNPREQHSHQFEPCHLDRLEDPDVSYVLNVAESDLLTKLDKAVSQCDTDSQHSVADLETLETRLLVATLVLLLLEALFIFRPLANRVKTQVQKPRIDMQKRDGCHLRHCRTCPDYDGQKLHYPKSKSAGQCNLGIFAGRTDREKISKKL